VLGSHPLDDKSKNQKQWDKSVCHTIGALFSIRGWCREGDFIFSPRPGLFNQQVAAFSVT
jgi:hypothetical protein